MPSVLHVDDDPDMRRAVQATLSSIAGLDVHTAGSGLAAIALARELLPDLMLMDVMMPGLDGLETLELMRRSATIAAIPVIFLTAKVHPAEVAHFIRLGAIGVIGKPFDPVKLGDEVLALWDTAAATPLTRTFIQSAPAPAEAGVGSLAHRFLERTRADVVRLECMVERACRGETSVLQDIGRLTHSIHGTGAMFGYREVSAAAGSIEAWVSGATQSISSPGHPIDSGLAGTLLELIKRLSRETDAAALTVP